jgi:tetratricopeptide (TPR) repeat protein
VSAHRELAFVEVQAGRRATAEDWLDRATAIAETDSELAAILGVRGMNASDTGRYPAAFEHLRESVERAARAGDERQQAWSLSLVGRAHLLRGEVSQAAVTLAESIELIQRQRWVAFLPFPQTMQAELELSRGDLTAAADHLERAWMLALQVDDPCWEGLTARALGLMHAVSGDHTAANGWLAEAATRAIRVPDRYQWVHAHVLDAMVATALDRDDVERARPWAMTLSALAARCELKELVVRAHLHRGRMGDPAAAASAAALAKDIDNPALATLVAGGPA